MEALWECICLPCCFPWKTASPVFIPCAPLLGQAGRFLRSVNVLGGKERNCVHPLTVHWIGMNLPWNPCRQTMDREAVFLKAEKCPDLLRFLPQRSVQICMVYMVISQDLRPPDGRESKHRTISPSADPSIFWKSLTVYPPQQHTVHCPGWNWRGMGEEYSSLLMAVPSSIATASRLINKQLVRNRLAAASSRGWVSKYWGMHACLCLRNYSRSRFPPAKESRGVPWRVWLQPIQIPQFPWKWKAQQLFKRPWGCLTNMLI